MEEIHKNLTEGKQVCRSKFCGKWCQSGGGSNTGLGGSLRVRVAVAGCGLRTGWRVHGRQIPVQFNVTRSSLCTRFLCGGIEFERP